MEHFFIFEIVFIDHRLVYFDGSFCVGSPRIDRAGEDQNRPNDEPKDVLALLAAKDDLTNWGNLISS